MAAELVLFASSDLHMVHVRPKIVPHYPGYYVGPEMVEYARAIGLRRRRGGEPQHL